MLAPSLIELERELCQRSLREFAEAAWPILEPGNELEWNWHLDALCLHLEAVSRGEIRRLLITVPPRTLKSVLVAAIWPAWEWANRPGTRWMFGSYAESLAIRDAVKTRDLIRSQWFQERWPDVSLKVDSDRKSDYRTTKGGFRYSFGVSGTATGEGADIIVADDPLNAMDTHSDAKRKEANRWWSEVMPSRLNDRRTGRRVVVAQRLHENDVPGLCINAGYVHLDLPMEYVPKRHCTTTWTNTDGDTVTWTDPRSHDGESLDAARFPPDIIAELKDVKQDGVTARAYSAQYQQDPTPDDGSAIFPTECWNVWDHLPTNDDGTLRRPDRALVSWDMAFSGKPEPGEEPLAPGEPAWTVGQLWYAYGALTYLIDEARGQWQYATAEKMVEAFHERCCIHHPFRPQAHVVERKANGYAILSRLKGKIPGIFGFEPGPYGSKVQRAWAAQPRTEARQVYLPKGVAWLDDWRDELRKFPGGTVKDRVDAFSQAHLVLDATDGWKAL